MSTAAKLRAVDNETKLIVFGYMRDFQTSMSYTHDLPEIIIHICLCFYFGTIPPVSIIDKIFNHKFEDEDENILKVLSIRYLEYYRFNIYKQNLESLETANHVLAVECINNDNNYHQVLEHIVVINQDKIETILIEDKCIMEDLSPSRLVEYTFYNNGPWYLSGLSELPLLSYKGSKFKNWKMMIENPGGEAAFRRLLKLGVFTRIFDHVAFPSPEHEKNDWIDHDENGKSVVRPREVYSLRVWSPKQRCYRLIDPHLDGAPNDEDKETYWNHMLNRFKSARGHEYIDGLLKL